jgi:hypothetical protein
MQLYRCQGGAFLVVPDCIRPSMVAERTLGPLTLVGSLDIERLPPGVRERASREIQEDLFSMLRAAEVVRHAAVISAPVSSPTCPVCASRRSDKRPETSNRVWSLRVSHFVGGKLRALRELVTDGVFGNAYQPGQRRPGVERRRGETR